MLRFCLLGSIELRRPDGASLQSVLTQPKRIALLAYLALAKPNGFHRRDTLLGLFWPELNDARARAALSKTVHHLRQSLGHDALIGRGVEELTLSTEQFSSDCSELWEATAASDWDRVLSLYRGPFLDGFFLADAPEFEQWVTGERARFAAAAAQAARKLAERMAAQGRIEEAVTLARRAVELAPDDEPSFRRLLTALDAAGDRAGAARAFEVFTQRLETEYAVYAVEASAETQTLMQSIRKREKTNGDAPHAAASVVTRAIEPESERAGPALIAPAVTLPVRPRRRDVTFLVAAALSAIMVLVSIVALRAGDHTPLAGERVIVAPFTNLTGDSSLDGVGLVAADWITQGIVRTGFVDVVSSLDAFRSAQVLETPVGLPSSVALARELRVRALVTGSFHRNNGEIAFQAQIIDAETGAVLRAIDGVVGPQNAMHPAFETLQQKVLGSLATLLDERLANWTRGTTPPADFEAYKLFSEGMADFLRAAPLSAGPERRHYNGAAEEKFKAAAARDTTFTLPLIWVVFSRVNNGRDATEALDQVARVRDRLLPVERHMADYVLSLREADGGREKAFHAAKLVVEYAPDSDWQYKYALSAAQTARFNLAIDVLSRVDPSRGWMRGWPQYWFVLGTSLHMLGDCKREAQVLDQAAQQSPDAVPHYQRSIAHMCAGDLKRALAIVDSTLNRTNWFGWPLIPELRWHGHNALADSLANALVERMLAPGSTMINSIERRLSLGLYLIDAGRLDSARSVLRAIAAEPGPDVADVNLALMRIARLQNDRTEAARLYAQFPKHRAQGQAEQAIYLGNHQQALELLLAGVGKEPMLYLHRAPILTPLAQDPRFRNAFERRN